MSDKIEAQIQTNAAGLSGVGAAASGYALTCEHPGCSATQGVADYVRYSSDIEADEEGKLTAEEREDWINEPIALCPAHAGERKRA